VTPDTRRERLEVARQRLREVEAQLQKHRDGAELATERVRSLQHEARRLKRWVEQLTWERVT
jgi:hypothetical protein